MAGSFKRADTKMMKCDNCGKLLSMKGIKVRVLQDGQYEIRYFACPHCGFQYFCGCLDDRQRELLEEQKKILTKIRVGQKSFRSKTLENYQKLLAQMIDEAKKRSDRLQEIGELILSGISAEDAEVRWECERMAQEEDSAGGTSEQKNESNTEVPIQEKSHDEG